MARSQLRQCGTVVSRQRPLSRVDTRWGRPENSVWWGVPQVGRNCIGVKLSQHFPSVPPRDNPVLDPGGQTTSIGGLESPHTRPMSRAGGRGHTGKRGVVRVEGVGQKLSTKEVKVVLDREDLGLGMEVGNTGHEQTASDGSEGLILDELEGLEIG